MSAADDILYCDVAPERFAFRSRDVRHIERAEHLRPETADDGRVGVLMLGGHAVPVYSLGAVLGVVSDRAATVTDRHIAVTGNRDSLVGWLVDRVARADQSGAFHVAPMPALIGDPASRWFEGAVKLDEHRSALLIRPNALNPASGESFPPPPEGRAKFDQLLQSTEPAEPVAVVFMTDALPRSAATRYAISGRQIAAIVQPEAPIAVPGCAGHVTGVTWWRRTIAPVIDFRSSIDAADDPHPRRLIVRCGARHREALIALSIAAEVVMCRADGNHREMRELPRPWFASGIFDINGEPVALIDLDALLEGDPSGSRDGDAVLPDLLVERTARDAEPVGGTLDPAAFGA